MQHTIDQQIMDFTRDLQTYIHYIKKIHSFSMLQQEPNPELNNVFTDHAKVSKQIKTQFTRFLNEFQETAKSINPQTGQPIMVKKYKYKELAKNIIQASQHTLLISYHDFFQYSSDLAALIFNSYHRYQSTLNSAFGDFMLQEEKAVEKQDINSEIPNKEKYQVSFDKGFTDQNNDSVRDLKCQMLGKLRSIVGTVTRVSEIRPQLVEGVFQCLFCGRLSEKITQQYKYTTPKKCMKQGCDNNVSWELNNKHSVFADFQKIRVQQDSSKIPPGCMPRSIEVILRNDQIQKGQPGDQVHVVGYLSVLPDISSMLKAGERTELSTRNYMVKRQTEQEGVKGVKGVKELNYKLCFIGVNIVVLNNQFNENVFHEHNNGGQEDNDMTEEEFDLEKIQKQLLKGYSENQMRQILCIKQNPKLYENLANSLFPQIFSHIEIKKALLLQLLGGIHKTTPTKITIRGDINILIVGDPSTAKSQFLKCLNKFVPRSVYTNGKTTSAAGLTASVVRDLDTGNVSIEAGALLLADNGICCIDQFDKMDIKDQVAIHEAMEQQTISLAKAGVQATLHARTSILAAANPVFGRYDPTLPLRKNITISPPIMSRFDLYFIIRDEVNEESDRRLCDFIIDMHQDRSRMTGTDMKGSSQQGQVYDLKQIRTYISAAKRVKPRITHEAAEELRKYYIELRKQDKRMQNKQYQVTVRQLQSMIRLSEAYAKLLLDFEVRSEHVRQAYRLLKSSVIRLQQSEIELEDNLMMRESRPISKMVTLYCNKIQQPSQSEEKKEKKFKIDFALYDEIKQNIERLFEEKEERHKKDEIDEVQMYLTQEDVIAYLKCLNYESGFISTESENKKTEKIYVAVTNKLIQEKMLMVIEDSRDLAKKKLCLHPNYQTLSGQ